MSDGGRKCKEHICGNVEFSSIKIWIIYGKTTKNIFLKVKLFMD